MGLQGSKRKYETAGDSSSTKTSHGSWHLRKMAKQRLHNSGDVATSTAAGGDCTVEQQQQQERCHQTKQDQQGKSASNVRSESKILRIASNLLKRRMKPDAGDTCPANVDKPDTADAQFVDEQYISENDSGAKELKMRKPITEGTASTGDIPNEMSVTTFRRTESEQLSTVRRIMVDKARLSPVSASSPARDLLPTSAESTSCTASANESDAKLHTTSDSVADVDRLTSVSSSDRRQVTLSDLSDEISDYPKEDNCRWSPDVPADRDASTGDIPDEPLGDMCTSLTSSAIDNNRKTVAARYSHGSPDGDTDGLTPAECLAGICGSEKSEVENGDEESYWKTVNKRNQMTNNKQPSPILQGDSAPRIDHLSTVPRVDKYSLEMNLMTARNVSLVSLDQENHIGGGQLPPLKMSREPLCAERGRNANNNLPQTNCQQQQMLNDVGKTDDVISKADDISSTDDVGVMQELQTCNELLVSDIVSESVASEKEIEGNEVCRSQTSAVGDVICSGGVCSLVSPCHQFRLVTSPVKAVKHDEESMSGTGKGLPTVETP